MLEWYCIIFPLALPPSVAWGTMRTSPGRSKMETSLESESASLSRMFKANLAAEANNANNANNNNNTIIYIAPFLVEIQSALMQKEKQ